MLDFNLLDDNENEQRFEIEEESMQEIAIIGLAAQLPMVDDIEQFWQCICNGVDFITEFPEGRRSDVDPFARSKTRNGDRPLSYFEGAYLDRIDEFDYSFFRLSPKEASLMTPNQRLFLQTAWKSIEDAGYCRRTLAGSRTGVYVGFNSDSLYDYKRMISDTDPELLSMGVPGNISSIIAGRISYLLDLNGPSLCVDTACSSSLVAIHLACQAIRNRECEMAIAGSVKINLLPLANEVKIGIESSSGRARTFDDGADGTGAGEGVIAFLLKPLGKALRDGDAIHAVIKGSAVNQDGSSVGLTAPNVAAQEDVLVRAWDNAGIHPATISYMEAHGTGTKLGDPIEIAGMDRAFRKYTDRKQFVAVGSVKSNVGHLDHAAGAMGMLKAIFAMKRKQIPPLLHFARPNRSIDFIDSPIYVNDRLSDWPAKEYPRRCGVSAFGISGTNCHLVLEEAPNDDREKSKLPLYGSKANRQDHLLTLSAKSESALRELAALYRTFDWGEASAERICYTALTGRDHHEYRLAIVFRDRQDLQDKLDRLIAGEFASAELKGIYYGSRKSAAWSADDPIYAAEDQAWEELAKLYAMGADIDWDGLYAEQSYARVHIPTYPFERSRCWLNIERITLSAAVVHSGENRQPAVYEVELTGRDQDAYTSAEKEIARIWGEVLGFRQIHYEDNFFELGGDSILALKIANRIRAHWATDLSVADLFTYASLNELAAFVERRSGDGLRRTAGYLPLPPAKLSDYYPLTSSQLRVFAQEQFGSIGTANNTPFCVMVEGELDSDRVNEAFARLVDRHESLRTAFEFADGEARQRVVARTDFEIELHNGTPERLDDIVDAFIRPFDLSCPPLLRVGLVTLQANRNLLMIDLHHIMSDGMSTGILMKEFCDLYNGIRLAELKVQYKDYAVWQQRSIKDGELRDRKAYWTDQLSGELPVLELPYDFPRPESKLPGGSRIRVPMEASLKRQLEQLAIERRLTMNSLLFALYALLLHGYSNQDSLIVGTLVAGRNHPDLERVFGMFINFLPIHVRFAAKTTFSDYLTGINEGIGKAYANDYPFDLMLSDLALKQDRSRNPLYDTMFVYHNEYKMNSANPLRLEVDGLSFAEYPLNRPTSSLDVKLDVWQDSDDQLVLVLEYDTALFAETTMKQWVSSFLKLAEASVSEPEAPLSRLLERNFAEEHDEVVIKESAAAYDIKPSLSVAISATFTAEQIGDHVNWWCGQFDLPVGVSFAPYHQVFQELLDHGSLLGRNDGVNVLLIRFEDWIRDDESPIDVTISKLEKIYSDLIEAFGLRKKGVPHFVGIFPVSDHLLFESGLSSYLVTLNERWRKFLGSLERVFVLELNEALADSYEVRHMYDEVTDQEGHAPFTDEFYAVIGTAIARKLIAWKRQSFKVVVLDCDNTLWKGICGEDGPTGVEISGHYQALQRFMLDRYEEGMLLAISSKNNEADVWETFERHPDMLLRKEHIAAARIHWGAKSTAVREIAEQLNLGLDSFIFVDDSGMECAEMMQSCPSVLTLQLPEDERHFAEYLRHVWGFDRLVVTEEDRKRTALYAAESIRRQYLQEDNVSMEQFLRGLGLRIVMASLREDHVRRAAQLTQRTNQFNMHSVPRTENELTDMLSISGNSMWSIEVEDRFGEYGFVGLLAGKADRESFILDTFLLSCRVLGRGVEQAILSELKRVAASCQAEYIEAQYVSTDKNAPFHEFLETSGWRLENNASGRTAYRLRVDSIPDCPPHIMLTNERLKASVSHLPSAANFGQRESAASTSPTLLRTVASVPSVNHRPSREEGPRDWHSSEAYKDIAALRHARDLLPLRYHNSESLLRLVQKRKQSVSGRKTEYSEPVTAIERELVELWEDLLGIQPIGVTDPFFEIGGNSLQAVSLASRIHRKFDTRISLRDLFAVPTIRGLAALIHRTGPTVHAAIEPAEHRDCYPVTSAQKRLLVLSRMDGARAADTAYNQPCFFEVEGEVNVERFQAACEKLVHRHESLRTSFRWQEGEFVQIISPSVDFAVDLFDADTESRQAHIDRFIRPFDLEHSPLFRAGMVRMGEAKWLLMFDMHHVVSDGVSIGVMIQELLALYQGEELPEMRIQYRDYAVWQTGLLHSDHMRMQERYWLESFSDEVPVLNMPLDSPRTAIRSHEGKRLSFEMAKTLHEAVRSLAADVEATPFMVYLSAYYVLLAKYSGQEDIVVGSPVAGRSHADLDRVIGMFVHTLALRNKPEGNLTFRRFLVDVKENTLRAMEHQDYPFERLVDKLALRRDLSRNPLFDTMFAYQNMSWADGDTEEAKVRLYPYDARRSRFDFTLELAEHGDSIRLNFEYATELFHEKTMERLIRHYTNILAQVTRSPDQLLSAIDMLDDSEKARLLFGFNATHVEYETDRTMHSIFEEQACQSPDAIAVVYGNERLTYGQLNDRANRLAMELRERGAAPNHIVGIMVERSPEMVVAVLGVLKAGAAYLPIDPQYPEERIRYMLEDSGTGIVISQLRLAERIPAHLQTLHVDDQRFVNGGSRPITDNLEPRSTANDLAYVIYTSGSTGKPKGVMVEHRGMVNLQVYFQLKLKVANTDKIAQFASFSFDASVWEMFMSLFNGGELHVLASETIHHYDKLEHYFNDQGITVATLPPTYLAGLRPDNLRTLRAVITAGSASTADLLAKWRGNLQYVNAYGPTETTICATAWTAPPAGDSSESTSVPIGIPIPNAQAYIVNEHDQLQPIGVPGELCIGGAGLARGYLHRPELTAKQFAPNPFVSGTRMYRTGDQAKWLADGTIEYVGRIDDQVKIRGFRIELGELGNCLSSHPKVTECIVVPHADSQGGIELCAYIGTDGHALAASEIRRFVGERLPDYMVPAYVVVLDKLPLTSNGKVDKRALPEPVRASDDSYVPPTNETERRLAWMWSDILAIEKIGIQDHFFELGGHSLKAIALLTRIHEELGVELMLKQLFQAPTIQRLSNLISNTKPTRFDELPAAEARSNYPVTHGQKKLFVLQQLEGAHTAYNIAGAYRIEGEINIPRLEASFEALLRRHEALRTSFAVEDGEFVQFIHPNVPFAIQYGETSEDRLEETLRELVTPFDLSRPPLVRVALLKLLHRDPSDLDAHVLFIDMHHLISDGVSSGILIGDFLNLYEGIELEDLRIHYKDYAVWQSSPNAVSMIDRQERYWMESLSGDLPSLQLPTDFPRPSVQSFEGAHVFLTIDEELTDRLRKVAAESGSTLYMVLLAGFFVLLSKYSGQEDLIVGTPSAGRTHADLQRIIGMFVNTLVIRTRLSGHQSFKELLETVKDNALSAFDNQIYPFEMLVEKLNLPRDVSRNPLFDVLFMMQNFESVELKADRLAVAPYSFLPAVSKFDLSLEAAEKEGGLALRLEYAVKLYRLETANRLLDDYAIILSDIATNPEVRLQDIRLHGQIAKRKIAISEEIEFNF
ncbi:non-ribosomal peptide synthetase [Cohnella herbarum]|uniref:Amino acid adenylation domain-containing protein n=1 Tax=Cohnella herbarum TaxID=2728023 RepID=A0A7Z2VF60_9BACL|nr:non-ribosomal peptide synthetase [Cohnella herbarum]QJD81939.1 amino acid adenylation domain-containing protein [Cohnella herbarum]